MAAVSGLGSAQAREVKSLVNGVALPLAVTLAVQTLVAFAVYCAPVMAPVALNTP